MLEYLKIVGKIDEVADKLQEMGFRKEAEHLDMIANTIEAMELEAGWLSKFLAGLGLSVAMLGSLTPSQAQQVERGWAKMSPQQIEVLKKSDPKSYAALQQGIQKTKMSPEQKTQRSEALKNVGPNIPKNAPVVENQEFYSNPSRGTGVMQKTKFKTGPGKTVGEAPSPGGGYGGSAQEFFKQHGNYIPEKK